MSAFLIALQFLTRLPIRLPGMPAPAAVGRSLLSYPLVGLLIGALLLSVQWALQEQPPALQAALLLALWVGLTGALRGLAGDFGSLLSVVLLAGVLSPLVTMTAYKVKAKPA